MSEPIFATRYLAEATLILRSLDPELLERLAWRLHAVRTRGGRLFVCGLGGSAATASHAVNDFRKLCGLEAYCPTDNVAELTARANDDGFSTALVEWLRGSHLGHADGLLALSVSGESPALVAAVHEGLRVKARVVALLGRSGSALAEDVLLGATRRRAEIILLPCPEPARRTAHAEGMMGILLHLLISHPALQVRTPAWESRAA